jgi:2,3,4,5-tetrahydropyridine-2-carboxylate N-succinyltransferase
MIDSHALVGSCAQVGRRVHVSAGAQIGGVLEPVGALPVIVEDEVVGETRTLRTIVERRAPSSRRLTGSSRSDIVRRQIYRKTHERPLTILAGYRHPATGTSPSFAQARHHRSW